MILFFDTETTGLHDFNKRASDPSQPHIVSLGAELTTDDGEQVEWQHRIIKPEGWVIPLEATQVHGITHERALREGTSEREAAAVILSMIHRADLIVAHNVSFDKFIARIALRRYGMLLDEHHEWWKNLKTFCTMRETTDLCAIPRPRGSGYKYPKLGEAYLALFNRSLKGAHNAVHDVIACKEIFFELQRRAKA